MVGKRESREEHSSLDLGLTQWNENGYKQWPLPLNITSKDRPGKGTHEAAGLNNGEETGGGAAIAFHVRSRLILGILGTLVPPPKAGSPDGSSSYTWNLPPPFGCTRRERPGWLPAMSHGGPPTLWVESRATHSSPPPSSAPVYP